MKYAAEVFGWVTVLEAANKREALKEAKATARSASLLPSDVTASHIKPATQEQIDWYNSMCQEV